MMLKQWMSAAFSETAIIPWMLIVAIVPMILVSIFAYEIAKDIFHRSIDNTLIISIQKKVEEIDNFISERRLNLLQITELPTLLDIVRESSPHGQLEVIKTPNVQILADYLNHLGLRLGITNIYIINMNGEIVFSLTNRALLGTTISTKVMQQTKLYRAFDGAKVLRIPYLVNNYQAIDQTNSSFYLSNPIYVNGVMKAIFIMQYDPRKIIQVITRSLGFAKSEEIFLATEINNQAHVVLHTKASNLYSNLSQENDPGILYWLQRAIRGEPAKLIDLKQNGIPKLAVYHYVPQLDMGMLMQYDRAEMLQRITQLKMDMIFLLSISFLLAIIIVFWISRALWQANIKSELLLENILPKFVIQELKEKKQFPARTVHNVSVVFIDTVNFTPFVLATPAGEVVAILDELFSLYDKLSDEYQLEKIKTIGDAYMAVSGLTSVQADHANRAVNFGLAAITAIKNYNLDHPKQFSLRVGIDSGSVTTGIIGKRKFSYDLWGNPVNRASRMESTGIENTVQITHDTYIALQNREQYHIEPRMGVAVKGLGEMDTYLITERMQ